MIRLADSTSKQQVWDIWKACFGDPDDYMELYFRDKYRPEDTLLYMEGSKAVASLQMLHYQFTFHGTELPVIYLSGVCTLPEYRRKGYTRALLIEGFNEAIRRKMPLMFLVPQEKWLIELYAKYGFVQAFDLGTEDLLSLKELVNRYPGNLKGAYDEFNSYFRKRDMTVQKTFNEFKTIVEEAALFDFPAKRSLPGMARVIDAKHLLSLFVSQQGEGVSFNINVTDELIAQNNLSISLSDSVLSNHSGGASERVISDTPGPGDGTGTELPAVIPSMDVDIRDFTQLLLGYHTAAKGEPYSLIFPEKSPQIHFMLE